MSAGQPTLHIVAGPNGAGKSTLTGTLIRPLGIPVLDPDAIGRNLASRTDERQVRMLAGREALRLRRLLLDARTTFCVETTLAGQSPLQLISSAKTRSFAINLIYVCVESAEIAVDRVAQRVTAGGHVVPEEDVRRRYARSLANLPAAIVSADTCTLYDNSLDRAPQRVIHMEHGRTLARAALLPAWATSLLQALSRPPVPGDARTRPDEAQTGDQEL